MKHNISPLIHHQRGASAVEFAFIAAIFFGLLFGIVEFGRLFFSINSVQEITRRAAREQVVRWVDAADTVQRLAVLRPGSTGTVYFPGALDIRNDRVQLAFYNTYANAVSSTSPITGGATSQSNLNNCLTGSASCIRFVRARLMEGGALVDFGVLAPFMPFVGNVVPLPDSTVIMPAEALGLL